MEIRAITGPDRLTASFPLQFYAFDSTPAPMPSWDPAYFAELATLGMFDGDGPLAVACATRIPMTQNIRGRVLSMAGIAGVAAAPTARRGGHVRKLLDQLLRDAVDDGAAVSALYPFRSSFYERFGYVGLPKMLSVSLDPASLAPLLRRDLVGEVTWHRIGEVFEEFREFQESMLPTMHGFALRPLSNAVLSRDLDGVWMALARVDGRIVGALPYTITGHLEELRGGPMVCRDPHARALLLQYLARHIDQVTSVTFQVAPSERPELWLTDLEARTTVEATMGKHYGPMGRVLAMDGLAGLAVGAGSVGVEIVDDPLIAGVWTLSGEAGELVVSRGGRAEATLTVPGMSALVYGVLDPAEFAVRGFGSVPGEAAAALRALFPPVTPWLMTEF